MYLNFDFGLSIILVHEQITLPSRIKPTPLSLVQNSLNFGAHFCYFQKFCQSNLIVKVALCGKPYCKDTEELKVFFLEFRLGYLGAYKKHLAIVGYSHECLYSLVTVLMLSTLFLVF